MNVNFEYSKTLAMEGSVMLLLSLIPYVGWVLGIVGVVLLLRATKEFSNYYQDESIYQNSLTGIKFYIVAIVAAAVAIVAITLGVWSATTGFTPDLFAFTAGFGIGLIAFLAGIIVAFVFYILAASHLKRTFDSLADKSGEGSFRTAGTLLWVGSLLTIFVIGLLLILVAWIFATIGFFTMKSRQYQQYPQSNGYGYTPPPTQPQQSQAPTPTGSGP